MACWPTPNRCTSARFRRPSRRSGSPSAAPSTTNGIWATTMRARFSAIASDRGLAAGAGDVRALIREEVGHLPVAAHGRWRAVSGRNGLRGAPGRRVPARNRLRGASTRDRGDPARRRPRPLFPLHRRLWRDADRQAGAGSLSPGCRAARAACPPHAWRSRTPGGGSSSAQTAGMACIGITHSYPAAELTDAETIVSRLDEITTALIRQLASYLA